MRSWRFHTENGEDEQPSIAEQIPEPRKEQGGDNTNPVAPRPEVKERHIDVNVNINMPFLNFRPRSYRVGIISALFLTRLRYLFCNTRLLVFTVLSMKSPTTHL